MRGVWAFGLLLACWWTAEAHAQVNARGEPDQCPAVRARFDLETSRRFVPRPVALTPPANWKPLIPGSEIYCEDFNTQDRNLAFIRSRTIVEHGIDKGIEFKIDYGLGEFYVARGKAQNLKDATAVSADITGPYWRGSCTIIVAGKETCTFTSGEGVQFVYVAGLKGFGLVVNFCAFSAPDFRPESATLTSPSEQEVAVIKPSGCTSFDLGAPGRALVQGAERAGYMDVTMRGKTPANDTVEVKRRVVFANAQAAFQLARKVIDSQLKGAPKP
jgi:hypothetical protein